MLDDSRVVVIDEGHPAAIGHAGLTGLVGTGTLGTLGKTGTKTVVVAICGQEGDNSTIINFYLDKVALSVSN